jgi:hypothetical protein
MTDPDVTPPPKRLHILDDEEIEVLYGRPCLSGDDRTNMFTLTQTEKDLYWLLWTSVQIIASRRTVDQASTHCRSRGTQDTIRKWKHVLTLPHAQQLIFAKEKLIL